MAETYDIELTQFDTEKPLELTLKEEDGSVVDVTNKTVTVWMSRGPAFDSKVAGAAMTKDDAVNGEVSYAWLDADVDTHGTFQLQVRTVDVQGRPRRYPTGDPLKVRIWPAIAQEP